MILWYSANMQNRTLYFGDNLEILRDKFPAERISLRSARQILFFLRS